MVTWYESTNWDAVQGLGSLIAIATSLGIVAWQSRKQRMEANVRSHEFLLSRVQILRCAHTQLCKLYEALRRQEVGVVKDFEDEVQKALIALNDAKYCQLVEMQTPAGVDAMASGRSAVLQAEEIILNFRGKSQAHDLEFSVQLQRKISSLNLAIHGLEIAAIRSWKK